MHKINLFFAAILIIIVIFLWLPKYNEWITAKIINGADYYYQVTHLGLEDRMSNRFGTSYNVYSAIEKTLKASHINDPIILLPPKAYVKSMKLGAGDFDIVEPEIFYYFTGFKSVSVNSPDLARADWALVIENQKPGLRKITDTGYLNQLVSLYKKFN